MFVYRDYPNGKDTRNSINNLTRFKASYFKTDKMQLRGKKDKKITPDSDKLAMSRYSYFLLSTLFFCGQFLIANKVQAHPLDVHKKEIEALVVGPDFSPSKLNYFTAIDKDYVSAVAYDFYKKHPDELFNHSTYENVSSLIDMKWQSITENIQNIAKVEESFSYYNYLIKICNFNFRTSPKTIECKAIDDLFNSKKIRTNAFQEWFLAMSKETIIPEFEQKLLAKSIKKLTDFNGWGRALALDYIFKHAGKDQSNLINEFIKNGTIKARELLEYASEYPFLDSHSLKTLKQYIAKQAPVKDVVHLAKYAGRNPEARKKVANYIMEYNQCKEAKITACFSTTFNEHFRPEQKVMDSIELSLHKQGLTKHSLAKEFNLPLSGPLRSLPKIRHQLQYHQFDQNSKQDLKRDLFQIVLEHDPPYSSLGAWLEHSFIEIKETRRPQEVSASTIDKIDKSMNEKSKLLTSAYHEYSKKNDFSISPFEQLHHDYLALTKRNLPIRSKKAPVVPAETKAFNQLKVKYPNLKVTDLSNAAIKSQYNQLVFRYQQELDEERKRASRIKDPRGSNVDFKTWQEAQRRKILDQYKKNTLALARNEHFQFLDKDNHLISIQDIERSNILPGSPNNLLEVSRGKYIEINLRVKGQTNSQTILSLMLKDIMDPKIQMDSTEFATKWAPFLAYQESERYYFHALELVDQSHTPEELKKGLEALRATAGEEHVFQNKKLIDDFFSANDSDSRIISLVWEEFEKDPNYWRKKELLAIQKKSPTAPLPNKMGAKEYEKELLNKHLKAPSGSASAKTDGHKVTYPQKHTAASNTPKNKAEKIFFYEGPESIKQFNVSYPEDFKKNGKPYIPKEKSKISYHLSPLAPKAADYDHMILIPKGDQQQLEKIDVYGLEGKKLVSGVDYEVLVNPSTNDYALKIMNPEIDKVRFRAGFSDVPPPQGGDNWKKLKIEGLTLLIDELDEAGFKKLSTALKEHIQKSSGFVHIDDLEKIFKKSSLYSYLPEKAKSLAQEGTPFYEYAKFLNHEGVMCTQCDGSNGLFSLFMQLYFENVDPSISFETRTSYSRASGSKKLGLDDLHARSFAVKTDASGQKTTLGVWDVTPPDLTEQDKIQMAKNRRPWTVIKEWFKKMSEKIKDIINKRKSLKGAKVAPPKLPVATEIPKELKPSRRLQEMKDDQVNRSVDEIDLFNKKLKKQRDSYKEWLSRHKDLLKNMSNEPPGRLYHLTRQYQNLMEGQVPLDEVIQNLKRTHPTYPWPQEIDKKKLKSIIEELVQRQMDLIHKVQKNPRLLSKYPLYQDSIFISHAQNLSSLITNEGRALHFIDCHTSPAHMIDEAKLQLDKL